MIKVKASTAYQGKVALRDKYIKRALDNKEDIIIEFNNNSMLIPFDKIEKSIIAKSETPYPDFYSEEFHYLLYFKWKPQLGQKTLL